MANYGDSHPYFCTSHAATFQQCICLLMALVRRREGVAS